VLCLIRRFRRFICIGGLVGVLDFDVEFDLFQESAFFLFEELADLADLAIARLENALDASIVDIFDTGTTAGPPPLFKFIFDVLFFLLRSLVTVTVLYHLRILN